VQISRNGRYVIQAQEVYVFSNPYRVTRRYRDLQTGTAVDLDFPLLGVLSDGRVLGSDAEGWFLWSSSGAKQRIAGTAGLVTPLISDNGARIIAASRSSIGSGLPELVAIAVDTGRQTSLGRGIAAGISNDGLRALILGAYTSAEAHIVDMISGTRSRLVPGTRINVGALAGFGHSAVLATTDGRLLKVSVATGHVEELIPHTPYVSSPSEAVPCSALLLNGVNLTGPSEMPSVTLDGEPIPVLAASETVVWVQVPCELEPSPGSRSLDLRSASPFGAATSVEVRRSMPAVVPVTDSWGAAHQDFSGPVTRERPASPGEIVHVWGTGFGPVDRVMRTGEPAPASPPARLLAPIACRENQTGASLEVLFAGLAPGLVGFYQMDLRVPADAGEFYGVTCTLPENVSFGLLMPAKGQR
jgi:uncharacterized protein (TIGR03437 family)